jgi:hypothetical protein
MKITIPSIVVLVLFALTGYAQSNYAVKGSAIDTAERKTLENATVMVLNAKDSILHKFTRVNQDGTFAINNLRAGKFVLVMSYPGYADYTEDFTLDDKNQSHDFGKVTLTLKSRLLKDVIIKGQIRAIKIKGDTTEFNAKAYVIQPNDRVEDLIKQFPGIEVDKDGKITAQGKTVEKVLVDGEEFFGDDPTLVTKNLRADMVDKVQLYDKKSDQATFTGIDDGQKTKTLNIKLKEDKKSGYFGKLDGGIGTRDFYSGTGMYNRFTAKQKFSAYGIASNTGKTGLGWQDSQKYGSSNNVEVNDNGGISFYFNDGDNGLDSFNGNYDGRGIPKATTGGVHYDGKWNKDNESINANYKIGQLDVNGTSNTQTQNNYQGGTAINTNTDQNFNNSMFRQKLDLTYLIKFDTLSTLKVSVDGTYKHGKTLTDYLSIGRTGQLGNDTLLNSNSRRITNDEDTHLFNTSLFYTHKFKKKGRTLSVLVSEYINNVDSKGYLNSEVDIYNTQNGAVKSSTLTDQLKSNTIKNNVLNSNVTYTEPLSKKVSLIFNYGININKGTADKRSYNKPAGGSDYTVLVDSLSNYYKLDQISNQIGAAINFKGKKQSFNIGTKVSDVSFQQDNQFSGDIFKRHFINWNPQATYEYNFSQQRSIYLYYGGYTNQPSINQIQPVKENTDPLNVFVGNQGLTPSFRSNLNIYFNDYKVLTNQYVYFSIGYNFTSNQIVNNTTTDIKTGKSTIQYINLKDKMPVSYYANGSFGRKTGIWGLSMGLNGNVGSNTNYSYTNGALNNATSGNYSGGININKYEKDKYDFYISAGPSYNVSKSSLQQGANNNGRGFYTRGNVNIYLPAKFRLSSDVNYTYSAPTGTFSTDLKRTLLNASISKSFFKANTLRATISGNDLLNQNVGFNRGAYGNTVSQNTYTTIQRYFMFAITWDFSQMGGPMAKK